MRMRMRIWAGLLACWLDQHADSVTPIFGFWVFLFSSFGLMALQVCIKYKAPRSSFCKGQGIDGRALDKAPFPFISTHYSARYHLDDGISPPHNLGRATSFPRVARGASSRLRHAAL